MSEEERSVFKVKNHNSTGAKWLLLATSGKAVGEIWGLGLGMMR